MCTSSAEIVRYQPVLSDLEQSTLLGFLAGYRGFTRDAYTLDLEFTLRPPATSSAPSSSAPASLGE